MFKCNFKLLENKKEAPFYLIKNESVPTIYVYDVISENWGVSARQFSDDLNKIDAPEIHLRINSPGGDVFAAKAMVQQMLNHKAKIIAFIDGLAASAATTLANGADEVRMADGGQYMIHNAWSFCGGDHRDMEKMSELLKTISADIAKDYAKKTGKTVKQIQDWMDDETWFTAEKALENGFIDAIVDKEVKKTAAKNLWDLSEYEKAPKSWVEQSFVNSDSDLDYNIEHLQRRLKMLERVG